ncbi:Putative cell wall binding repeat 2 [Peptostreptococcus russellii]|uniref:Putative cell wall binding repeat 2 n=1 Tax=Peptostreptococcus russellii TaxID=215200 RepID=A0A1H8HW56_9FIRM|nr:cell wall-binding repeat-containing protein [Peptostreptococcus russellii]SEN60362.1 Putative cell wall binding repeat 2 [Peptostreptococcus russellii]
MKKQIAVLMAAATAVTTVAPALASAADVNTYDASVSEINAKVKNALNERYKDKNADGINASNANTVDDYLNSRYAVVVTFKDAVTDADGNGLKPFNKSIYAGSKVENALKAAGSDFTIDDTTDPKTGDSTKTFVVKNANKLQGLIESRVIGNGTNEAVKVAIVDKGIKDGAAVETLTDKHYVVGEANDDETQISLNDAANTLLANFKGDKTYVDQLKINGNNISKGDSLSGDVTKIELTLKSGKEYTLEANDKAFNFDKPLDKNGNKLTLGNDVAQNVYDQVESFENIENKDGKSDTIVLPVGDTDVYTVQDVQASTIELGKIFTTKEGYTDRGADFVNGIIDARNYKNKSIEFNYNGVNYTLANGDSPISTDGFENKSTSDIRKDTDEAFIGEGIPAPIIEKSGDGYVLRYNVRVVPSSDKDVTPTILQFVVRGDSQKDLATVLADLNGENTVVSGHFTRLEGADRYSTAIEVSKEKFDPQEASTVVIVGGEALMDGLSAVPLASVKNAPILLSHPKSGLNDATLNEISRACKGLNRKTVYVVGGENSVPEKAVKQLEDKFGAVVMRVSGSDRYDTSLEVAKRLGYDSNINDTVYLAGGEGAADAMSISPVAADVDKNQVSPVLVVPKDSVKRSTRDFIANNFENGYIIGGESTVSSNVYRDINNAKDSTGNKAISLNRVAGSDRYDTNVQIIKQFYSADNSKIQVNGAIFTSGDTKFLVDAQTAGPLAASKKAPIVLAGSKLTNDQVDLLKDNGLLSDINTNVYQIGGVVSSDVMSVVVDKLGL